MAMKYNFDQIINRTASNAEKYQLRQQIFGTEDLLPMWVADMDIQTAPFITEALQQRATHPIYGYETLPESAYQAQIDWMQRRHQLNILRKAMLFSPSVVTTINVAIQAFTAPGDNIIVQQPVYFPFFKSVTNNSREVLSNPLKQCANGEWTFDIEQLKSVINKQTKLLLLCSPHNPVGRVWTRAELQSIAAICLENNIIVLADEIHSDLIYKPYRHIPFASLSETINNITLTAIGPGKTFNLAGLASSTVVISNLELRRKFSHACEANHIGHGNIFGHIAFEAAYRQGDEWLDQLLNYLQCNIDALQQLCSRYPDKLSMNSPQGTYLAWIDCSGLQMNRKQLLKFFTEEVKLGLGAGFLYGTGGREYMRLNFAVPKQIMSKAIKLIEKQLT
jgi:cysteine-S-conjugate beta-lyase